jgi:putative DNA primase/helicase
MWESIEPSGGITRRTLFKFAAEHGYGLRRNVATKTTKQPAELHERPVARRAAPGACEVWSRCEPATDAHTYIMGKRGRPDGLRVVSAKDTLTIRGERMAGWLVVPVSTAAGEIVSLQFIAPPECADTLTARGIPTKLNLPGAPMAGVFTVGELEPAGVVYLVEGVGTAWACWKATGRTAVVCFGWGMVNARARELKTRDPTATLVIVPDVGKEAEAQAIAREVGGKVAAMPEGWPKNSDVCDLGLRDGFDVVETVLCGAQAPPAPAPRYKLLKSADLRNIPPLNWRIQGVLPSEGLASIYGPSASGKSFLALDAAAAVACGREWFGLRVTRAPVVYCALEGETGLRRRVEAWESHSGEQLPVNLVMQSFKLTDLQDVQDLAESVVNAVGNGCVIILDTLNRAAPTADENSSRDMGTILEAAKTLQRMTGGLVVLVHHTGKDATKGLRGHSSLFAALDAALEVTRTGDRREWSLTKSKDGEDGARHAFNLRVVSLGLDSDALPLSSCVIVPDGSATEINRVRIPQGGNQKLAWEAIKPLFKDGAMGKPGAPPYRRCIELETAINFAANRLTCAKDRRTERARDAITGLASRGLLGCNDGWLWITT